MAEPGIGGERLLVGFDSAWTARRAGALVGVRQVETGKFVELGAPSVADFEAATDQIASWQASANPAATLIMLDQPTIVNNTSGQRPVENLVSGPVCRRYGGVQPSNTSRSDMFGRDAPLWTFLAQFGGAEDPRLLRCGNRVVETFPALILIALGWERPDRRPTGKLPKYNPERRKTFLLEDWRHTCSKLDAEFHRCGLGGLSAWAGKAANLASPRKRDQDCVDACLCLLAGIHLTKKGECLMLGDMDTGHIVVPFRSELQREVEDRCRRTGRLPADWVHSFCVG